jgi:hypothetical protein
MTREDLLEFGSRRLQMSPCPIHVTAHSQRQHRHAHFTIESVGRSHRLPNRTIAQCGPYWRS